MIPMLGKCGKTDDRQYSPGKALRKLPEPIERVEVGGLAIAGKGITVQLNSLQAVSCWLGQVVIIPVEGKH